MGLEYLYNLERFGVKLGLEMTREILAAIGNPQDTFRSIHIAGTNGKGSCAAFLAQILQDAGMKVGLYTSPHLVKFNERIKVDGVDISDRELEDLVAFMRPKLEHLQPTFFEFTTALAFLYLSRYKIDIAVVETGLGGRLDATNVLDSEISLITNIAMDHQAYLGTSLQEIAREKASIIKGKFYTTERNEQILGYFKSVNPKLMPVKRGSFKLSMLGQHQQDNASLAAAAARGLNIPEDTIITGLQKTFWPGRLQVLRDQPLILLDGAHNLAGAQALAVYLKTIKTHTLVLGISVDKEISKIMALLGPFFQRIIVTEGNFKPAAKEILATQAKQYCSVEQLDLPQAVLEVQKSTQPVVVAGSIYLVGDFLKEFSKQRVE